MVLPYLVPNPPPKQFWNPVKNPKFAIFTDDGTAEIYAFGCDNNFAEYKIDLSESSQHNPNVISTKTGMEYAGGAWFTKFNVSGLTESNEVGLFEKKGSDWNRISELMVINFVRADLWGGGFIPGVLPVFAKNKNISLYPYGSMQCSPPVKDVDWLRQVQEALSNIYTNPLGQKIIDLIKKKIVIHPYLPVFENASTSADSVFITPSIFMGKWGPGQSADEILFHELIHVIEGYYNEYIDINDDDNFKFTKTDFMTINATNVYSCLLGRGLRKDHADFSPLPDKYFVNPRKHFELFNYNYSLAKNRSADLFNILKNASNLWNPFIFA